MEKEGKYIYVVKVRSVTHKGPRAGKYNKWHIKKRTKSLKDARNYYNNHSYKDRSPRFAVVNDMTAPPIEGDFFRGR